MITKYMREVIHEKRSYTKLRGEIVIQYMLCLDVTIVSGAISGWGVARIGRIGVRGGGVTGWVVL